MYYVLRAFTLSCSMAQSSNKNRIFRITLAIFNAKSVCDGIKYRVYSVTKFDFDFE